MNQRSGTERLAALASRSARALTSSGALQEEGRGYGSSVCDPDGRLPPIVAGDAMHADVVDTIDRPRKLSHVVLDMPDPTTPEAFYNKGLGFRLADRTLQMSFINCNEPDSIGFFSESGCGQA